MPVDVQWENQDRAILSIQFENQWAWKDYYWATSAAWKLEDSVVYPVSIIFDFTSSTQIPPGALRHLQRISLDAHPNRGLIVLVGASDMVKMLYRILLTRFPYLVERIRIAQSKIQACDLILAEYPVEHEMIPV